MAGVYKVVELIGTSPESWEKAAANVIAATAESLDDLRIAEVEELDVQIDDGKVVNYRVKLSASFKYHKHLDLTTLRVYSEKWSPK